MLQGHRDLESLQSSVWKLKHWRATVAWSMLAELPKILVFSKAKRCLDGRRREGAIVVQQRFQWSGEEASVTSALRLHDATNAYLSTKHGRWPNRQQIRWCSKMCTIFFDQRISLASATISDEEGEIDHAYLRRHHTSL